MFILGRRRRLCETCPSLGTGALGRSSAEGTTARLLVLRRNRMKMGAMTTTDPRAAAPTAATATTNGCRSVGAGKARNGLISNQWIVWTAHVKTRRGLRITCPGVRLDAPRGGRRRCCRRGRRSWPRRSSAAPAPGQRTPPPTPRPGSRRCASATTSRKTQKHPVKPTGRRVDGAENCSFGSTVTALNRKRV